MATTNEDIRKDISKLYTNFEVLSIKVESLLETVNSHVSESKETAKESGKKFEELGNKILLLVSTLENNHIQSTESKQSIQKLEEKIEKQGNSIRSFQAIINFVRWCLSFVGVGGVVAFLSWIVQKK